MRYIFFILISFSTLFANAHIFVYHRFEDIRYPSANTTVKELTKQFEYFKKHNYKVVPLKTILDKVAKKETIPNNWIALTIDDAYKSFYNHGLDVFKKYNYPFSLFVYVEASTNGFGDFMNWKQLKETSKYGEIGLHSYSHPRLQNLTTQEIISDTNKSYNIFTKKMGFKPTTYAYPYGEYTKEVRETLKNNFDFKAILNQSTGSINNDTNLYDVPRIALVGEVNIEHKLRYKSFQAQWYEPELFPEDGILRRIHAKVDPKIKRLKLYITKEGWRDVDVKDGIVDLAMNTYLKDSRTRIMLGPDVFTISNKVINKIKRKKNDK
ncbi:MAG: polysaccharide deacetylase family protein [Campylobacterota bacterium]|nr:polysaccharide deacetylase family protein [Campylobacterota bacterium]